MLREVGNAEIEKRRAMIQAVGGLGYVCHNVTAGKILHATVKCRRSSYVHDAFNACAVCRRPRLRITIELPDFSPYSDFLTSMSGYAY